jgi:tetratricopeptide (TPR) repeat protein
VVPDRPIAPRANNSAPTAGELVAAFDRGGRRELRAQLVRVPDLRRTIRDYRDGGAVLASEPRREAVFVLALAEVGLFGRDSATRDEALALLGAQHDLVRQPLGADAFECAWYGGELALLEGGLMAAQAVVAADHALERCPNDARALLGRAIATDQLWSIGNARASAPRGAKLPTVVTDVLLRYNEVLTSSGAAAEAHVRSAWASFRVGSFEEALGQLDDADSGSAELVVRFFSQFVRGQVLKAQGRADKARDAFAQALVLWPGAQSARVALMTTAATTGDKREAESLAEAIQSAPADQIDPWWVYWQGDYRMLDAIAARLLELAQ